MPGGSPGFDPFMHQAFPAPQPYFAAPPQPRPAPRPVVYQQPQPRPQPPKLARAAAPAEPVALKPVELPAPEALGIHLDAPAVVLPAPEQLGIRLE